VTRKELKSIITDARLTSRHASIRRVKAMVREGAVAPEVCQKWLDDRFIFDLGQGFEVDISEYHLTDCRPRRRPITELLKKSYDSRKRTGVVHLWEAIYIFH
jgi:hypothetical protein